MTTQAKKNIRAGLGVLVMLSLLAGVPVSADIYMYRDADGVMHFTNTPVSTKYRIYVRSSQPRLRPSPGSRRYDRIIQDASQRYGVDLVLNGHDHFYERSIDDNGVMYVIAGGGGAPLYCDDACATRKPMAGKRVGRQP